MRRADTSPPTKTKIPRRSKRQQRVSTNPSSESDGDEDDGEEAIGREKDEDTTPSSRGNVVGERKKGGDADPYSQPGGPRRFDYQRDEDSPKPPVSPSSTSLSTPISSPVAEYDVTRSPELRPDSSSEQQKRAEEKEEGDDDNDEGQQQQKEVDDVEEDAERQEIKTSPVTSIIKVHSHSSSDETPLKSPSTDGKRTVKSPTFSEKDVNLPAKTIIPDEKLDDVRSSPAESETFYSIENSPGGGSRANTTRRISEKSDLTISEPGFSILDDLVLRRRESCQELDLPSEFKDIVRDHIRHFGDVKETSELPAHVGQARLNLPSDNVRQKDGLLPHRSEDAQVMSGKLSLVDDDDDEKISDTLETISLTKDSVGSDAPLGGRGPVDLDVPPILPKRYILLFLLFLGFAVVYSLRVNINVAIVAMVNNRTRLNNNGRIEVIKAEFDWDSHTQALVIGAFYYGYWVLQVPGAWIAMKLGATRIFGYGVFLSALLSLITPVATRYHTLGIVGVRVAQGLVLGVTYPCVIAIWASWSPPLERSTMVTMTMAGSPVGNIIAIPVTGILAKYGFDGGWPSVFYFFGFLGVVWYIVWECVIYDKPENHPTISANEKRYIEKSIGERTFDPLTESLPWLAIGTSMPMWAIIFGHFGACWGYYTLFTQMPTYLKDVQHLDIKTMGLVASTPYLLKALLGPVGGISADMLVKTNYLTVRGVRVLFYAIGCLGAGFFILMTGYYSRKGEAITFLILGIGISGLNATGYAVNHLDLAPRYAGILMGITNTFATIPGFLSPMVTGFITKHKRASEWRIVFWITFVVYVVATILYSLMCSGEKQWWSEGYGDAVEEEEEEEEGEGEKEQVEVGVVEEEKDDLDGHDDHPDDDNHDKDPNRDKHNDENDNKQNDAANKNDKEEREEDQEEKQNHKEEKQEEQEGQEEDPTPLTHINSDTSVESLNSHIRGKNKNRHSTTKREENKGDVDNKASGLLGGLFTSKNHEKPRYVGSQGRKDDAYREIHDRYSRKGKDEEKGQDEDVDERTSDRTSIKNRNSRIPKTSLLPSSRGVR